MAAAISAIFTEAPDPASGEGGAIRITKADGTQIDLRVGDCIHVGGESPYDAKITDFNAAAANPENVSSIGIILKNRVQNAASHKRLLLARIPRSQFNNIISTIPCMAEFNLIPANIYHLRLHGELPRQNGGRKLSTRRRHHRRRRQASRRR